MTIEELKGQLVTLALKLDNEMPSVKQHPIEFLKEHFLTINEAIVYADAQGVKLRSNPIQQFHLLCKNDKVESTTLGENGFRVIVKASLDRWIEQQKQKQGRE